MKKSFEIGRKDTDRGQIKFTKIILSNYQIYLNYSILFLCNMVGCMSVSSYASITDQLTKEYKLSGEATLGWLATVHYLGSMFGAFYYYLIINYNYRKVLLMISVMVNAITLMVIASSYNYYVLVICRFLTGFFTIIWAIFTPVWIDQYVSNDSSSILMSFHHIESIAGTIFGFLLTSKIADFYSWRYSFVIQSIIMLFFFLILSCLPYVYFARTMHRVGNTDVFIFREIVSKENENQSDPTDKQDKNKQKESIDSENYKDLKLKLKEIEKEESIHEVGPHTTFYDGFWQIITNKVKFLI